MRPRRFRLHVACLAGAACLALAACTTTPLECSVIGHESLQPQAVMPPLRCSYRLGTLADRRPDGDAAGALGGDAFLLENATALLKERMARIGLLPDNAGRTVDLELSRLYVTANQTTRTPVAVYRVSVDGGEPWIVRSRVSAMNWNTSRETVLRALAHALDDADRQLAEALNARCD